MGQSNEEHATAATDENTPETIPIGDAERGKLVFKQRCSQCHTMSADGKHRTGPSLYSFLDRQPGITPGFNFSEAHKAKDIIWTRETLWVYLENPLKYIPGSKMFYRGLRNELDRADVIAYIEEASEKPEQRT